jgi:hypothetical protein
VKSLSKVQAATTAALACPLEKRMPQTARQVAAADIMVDGIAVVDFMVSW